MDDYQAPALPLASATAAASQLSDLLSNLPLWQRRYLAAVEAGLTGQQAASAANVTAATISDWLTPLGRAYDPVFARAEQEVRHGVAIIGREAVRADGQAEAYVARRHAFMESQGLDPETGKKAMEPIVSYKTGEPVVIGHRPAIRAADRVANRRLVLEVAGAVGQGAQAGASATVVVRIERPAAYNGVPLTIIDAQPQASTSAPGESAEPGAEEERPTS